ncbi:MAG: methyltransferase domain-containing protein, partial [Thermodesulfobacteriota bacterium]|nr:methyltransferase domain-containing protein [Thermodesulfobacteriota bacterium]
EFNWMLLGFSPYVTLLNLAVPRERESNFTWVVADGRYLPFKEGAFELAYSNSVIEHLGIFENQQLFAAECRRVGRRYYVQTPNKWFFVEPHLITPFIHWLPRGIQKVLLRNLTVWGWITRPSREYCESFMREVRLLDKVELRQLFPDADIIHERFLGVSKSIIAVKASG